VQAHARRAALLVEVAGHGEGAADPAGDLGVLVGREVLDARDRVAGRRALDDAIGEVAVAELREGVVAHGQEARRQGPVAGRNTPGEPTREAILSEGRGPGRAAT
jgi:hypothetical protein